MSPSRPVIDLGEASRHCPLCGQPNECGLLAGVSDPAVECSKPCWCTEVQVSPAVLQKIPPHRRGQVCLCKNCLSK